MQSPVCTVRKSFIVVNPSFFCSTATAVMVATGWPRKFARKTEIVDVVNGDTCSNLANLPVKLTYALGANLDGTPVVCGGQTSSYV